MKNYLVLIQPPFTQLNSPYPSVYYLASYFKKFLNNINVSNNISVSNDKSISNNINISDNKNIYKYYKKNPDNNEDHHNKLNTNNSENKINDIQFKKISDNIHNDNIHIDKIFTFDLSIDLFNKIFSKEGLKRIFKIIEKEKYYEKSFNNSDNKKNSYSKIIKNYLLAKDFYINNIENIIKFLNGNDDTFYHYLLNTSFYPYSINGNKVIEKYKYFISYDEAKWYTSIIIEDLAHFINIAYDNSFELIKYNERKAISAYYFNVVEKEINNSKILKLFYNDIVENMVVSKVLNLINHDEIEKINIIIGVSIPFPGNLIPAFFTVRSIKNYFNKNYTDLIKDNIINLYFVAGGGYVNTELRYIKNKKVFEYFDFFVFDSGFKSLELIVKCIENIGNVKINGNIENTENELFKTITMVDNQIYCYNFDSYDNNYFYKINELNKKDGEDEIYKIIKTENYNTYINEEIKNIKNTVPDYSEVQFSRYITLLESNNKMYRLWSDAKLLKYYLAYGCYWHRCSFCDTALDYIKNYQAVNLKQLFSKIIKQKLKTIHFIDEALPLNHLLKFAFLNYIASTNFIFWGNIRFEKSFSYDVAELLSYLGFVGATAGVEIPSKEYLKKINKGITLKDIVKIAYNFKANGIALHIYLIYGYYKQKDKDIVNSMEFVRQLFENSLIDSGFWHKFVLTRHSTIYNSFYKSFSNFKNGFDSFKIIDRDWDFCSNDLSFENENYFDKYDSGLSNSMNNWIEGNKINKKLSYWFDFNIPEAQLNKNFVYKIIDNYLYEIENINFEKYKYRKVVWIGSDIYIEKKDDNNCKFIWNYKNKIISFKTSLKWANFLKDFLENTSIKMLKKRYLINKNCNNLNDTNYKDNIDFDKFINDYNSNKIFSHFIDFKNMFEKTLNFSFDLFIKSNNFKKLKKNGLLLI